MATSTSTTAAPVAPATRDAILDAVETLLGVLGYNKTTMEEIAREAQVSRRTVYCHFPNKQEVVLCSIDRIVERVVAALAEIAGSALAPDEKVRRMLCARVLIRFEGVQSNYASLNELLADIRPAYMARRKLYLAREAGLILPVLEDGAAQGTFLPMDAHSTAEALIDATNALLPVGLSPQEIGNRDTVQARVENIAELVVRGLTAPLR